MLMDRSKESQGPKEQVGVTIPCGWLFNAVQSSSLTGIRACV